MIRAFVAALALSLASSSLAADAPKVKRPVPAAVQSMRDRQKAERKALSARQKEERKALREKMKSRRAEIKAKVESEMAAE